MSENVSFIQGSKENYSPLDMIGGVYFSKDTNEILMNGEDYGRDPKWADLDTTNNVVLTSENEAIITSDGLPISTKSATNEISGK
jgi:hypothetical protein|nr:MAG TPA: hypothetical protein [Caudoviricetes sp.]